MYNIARCILGVFATSCSVEHCFSSLKWVRDEQQQDTDTRRKMHTWLHIFCILMDWRSELTSMNTVRHILNLVGGGILGTDSGSDVKRL